MATAVHFLAGVGLGCFKVKILLAALGISTTGTLIVGLAIPFNVIWPIVFFVIALQFGYVAGSVVSSLIAVRSRVRSEDGITDHSQSPSELAVVWALRHLGK